MPPVSLPARPADATLSVTKAARLLGVHANTIRAWSDAGRVPYYRINDRGDRRYRLSDLERLMAKASATPPLAFARPSYARDGRRVAARLAQVGVGRGDDAIARDVVRDRLDRLVSVGSLAAEVGDAGRGLAVALDRAARSIGEAAACDLIAIYRRTDDGLTPVGSSGSASRRLVLLPDGFGVLGVALATPGRIAAASIDEELPVASPGELAISIPGPVVDGPPWGAILAVPEVGDDSAVRDVLPPAAAAVGAIVRAARRAEDVARRLHRAEALRRVAVDIGSRADLERVLASVVDHALTLFGGDRGTVLLQDASGGATALSARGLSASYLAAIRSPMGRPLASEAIGAGRPLFAVGLRDDPRAAGIRAAIVQEGFDTICVAPMFGDGKPIGALAVFHDQPHPWGLEELETMSELAAQASVAVAAARDYEQLAIWAAQLQSIQQLGVHLSRLTSVREIGLAIATELRQLIDYHNVRVYRLTGDDLIPVALKGQVGEYVDETPEQLRVKLGSGITGWVAASREPVYLADAAHDPRANTIPGTEADLPESMLLAPMVYEDEVLGVVVLSKLGLDQFRPDDLRLLVIYASFAAQAMANADTAERLRAQSATLERQLRGQRDLLTITESILRTLEPRAILELVADRLGELVGFDNLSIELVDAATGTLAPVLARGADAAAYLEPWQPGEQGLAPWVVAHDEAALVADETADPRVNHFRGVAPGSLLVVPLRGREGAIGTLTLERLGAGNVYGDDEFELVKLFAAQVSIALQNAEVVARVEVRAATDDLTGLYDDGAFREQLAARVAAGERFSLIMLDLDGFKAVNDTLGHQAGDRLLRQIGDAIRGAARDSDAVYRYGGDEFTVILPGADEDAVGGVARRVLASVAKVGGPGTAWRSDGAHVTASIGVSTFPSDGATAEEILLAADRACYVAKGGGGGRIATAAEGLALAGQMTLQAPTPIDPSLPTAAA